MIPFPNIDPVALTLPIPYVGDIPVRWYGLAYVAGFLCGLSYFKWLIQKRPADGLTLKRADDMFLWVVLGIILGGRLGYVLFYNLPFFMEHPAQIFKMWQGGMSYHGGMLGVFIATLACAYVYRIHWIDITDRIAPGVCIGLFFGRLANFVNGELYGRVSDVPWAMIFPNGGPQPRHPSQLYEALLEGVILFLILHFAALKIKQRYVVSGLFMVFYGLFRSLIELLRQPDNLPHFKQGIQTYITQGQLLSLPMIAIGLILLALAYRSHVRTR